MSDDSEDSVRLEVRELILDVDIPLILTYWDTRTTDELLKMGVDANKLHNLDINALIQSQSSLPYETKSSYFVVWEVKGEPVGYSNLGKITFGHEAYMHLHMWNKELRHQGIGTEMILKSLSWYFKSFGFERVFCEPNAQNEAPNRALAKAGFQFVKAYEAEPGLITFPQVLNQWVMTIENFNTIKT
jgi:RimJ/RimL family protein N-acetyltransferase